MLNLDLHAFVDESGDLGFSEKSSKFFVVVYVITDNSFYLTTKMRRLKKRIKKAGYKGIQEFKFTRNRARKAYKISRGWRLKQYGSVNK